MSDSPLDLPPLYETVVDRATVEQLFADVSLVGKLREVRVKRGPVAMADEGQPTLSSAREALLSGAITGVQLRYEHNGAEWLDTIIAMGGAYRVVRIGRPVE